MKTPLILAAIALIAVGCDQQKQSADTRSLEDNKDSIQKSARAAKSEIEKEASAKKEIIEAEAKSAEAQIDAEKARAKAATLDAQGKLDAATQSIRDAGAAGAKAQSEVGASKNTVQPVATPPVEPTVIPPSTTTADQNLVDQIRTAVVPADASAAPTVQVMAAGGVVTLKGTVKTEAEKTRMETAARSVSGVTQVNNQIEVKTE